MRALIDEALSECPQEELMTEEVRNVICQLMFESYRRGFNEAIDASLAVTQNMKKLMQ
jgi:Tfp pilus assembly ATPase PilU